MAVLSKKKQAELLAQGYDLEFLKRVQPRGNLNFKPDRFFYGGDGVHTILTVCEYPTCDLKRFWLLDLTSITRVPSLLSGEHLRNEVIKKKLEGAIEEKATRISDNGKFTENQKEMNEIRNMAQLNQDIESKNIGMKGIYLRLYPTASTEEALFKRVKEVKEQLSKYKLTILTGELDFEYQAFYVPASKQIELPNKRRSTVISAYDLAGGYFFNHTKLEDKHGSYYGWTPTNGAVNFDFLARDMVRTRSFMLISGNPKMGQKTFSLKLNDDLYAKNHFIRNFDASGVFTEQTQQQYGLVLNLSGEANRINPFQVFPTVTNDTGTEVDEIRSFEMHIEKLKNMLKMLNPAITEDDIQTFDNVLTSFYIAKGMWYRNPSLHLEKLRATKIAKEECPILSDFVTYLSDVERQLNAKRNKNHLVMTSITRMKQTFETLLQSHASTFEGTTEFQDISDEKVVTFDFSSLKEQPHIFNAQVFSVLSLISADIVNNGKKCKQLLREDPRIKESDLAHYIVNIGDAQQLINPQYHRSVGLLATMMDSMGDNYAGVILSVNSLQGILFENGANAHHDPYITAVKRIFGLMQYRVFAQTSETDIPLLANALAGSMNQSELETLPQLKKGQLFMNTAGVGNIVFTQQMMDWDIKRYGELN